MAFGTQVDNASMVIFRYRPISDLTCDKNGGHFQDGRHRLKFFDIVLNQF